jgi:pre-mRNA 3'-end-processing factor FIP1
MVLFALNLTQSVLYCCRKSVSLKPSDEGEGESGQPSATRQEASLAIQSNQESASSNVGPSSQIDLNAPALFEGQPITEVNLDNLEEKPWRRPGEDITDYFNYGFNEETWKIYCDKQRMLREEQAHRRRMPLQNIMQPMGGHNMHQPPQMHGGMPPLHHHPPPHMLPPHHPHNPMHGPPGGMNINIPMRPPMGPIHGHPMPKPNVSLSGPQPVSNLALPPGMRMRSDVPPRPNMPPQGLRGFPPGAQPPMGMMMNPQMQGRHPLPPMPHGSMGNLPFNPPPMMGNMPPHMQQHEGQMHRPLEEGPPADSFFPPMHPQRKLNIPHELELENEDPQVPMDWAQQPKEASPPYLKDQDLAEEEDPEHPKTEDQERSESSQEEEEKAPVKSENSTAGDDKLQRYTFPSE